MSTKNLKPFNLQEALSGKAVMLRSGDKAFVRHHETELPVDAETKLVGYIEGVGGTWTWCEDGYYTILSEPSSRDIIGMWPETRIINGFEVPKPVQKSLAPYTTYYYPILNSVYYFEADEWCDDEIWHERNLERGLIFLCKEDAIATAKAMMGIDPNE